MSGDAHITRNDLDRACASMEKDLASTREAFERELEAHAQHSETRAEMIEAQVGEMAGDVRGIRDSVTALVTEQQMITRWVRPVAISVIGGVILGLSVASFNVVGRIFFAPANASQVAK